MPWEIWGIIIKFIKLDSWEKGTKRFAKELTVAQHNWRVMEPASSFCEVSLIASVLKLRYSMVSAHQTRLTVTDKIQVRAVTDHDMGLRPLYESPLDAQGVSPTPSVEYDSRTYLRYFIPSRLTALL